MTGLACPVSLLFGFVPKDSFCFRTCSAFARKENIVFEVRVKGGIDNGNLVDLRNAIIFGSRFLPENWW